MYIENQEKDNDPRKKIENLVALKTRKKWRQNLVTLKTRQTDCLDSVSRLPIFRPLFSCSWHDHWLTCIFYLWNEYAEHACVCWPRWIFSSYFSLTKMVVSMALEVGVRYCVYFQKWENNDMNRKYIGSARIVLCSHISSFSKANLTEKKDQCQAKSRIKDQCQAKSSPVHCKICKWHKLHLQSCHWNSMIEYSKGFSSNLDCLFCRDSCI